MAPDYPGNSPYAFAQNRVIDGIELEGLEWQPVNSQNENVDPGSDGIADYNWVGYEDDMENWQGIPFEVPQVAPEGTVSDAAIGFVDHGVELMEIYSTNADGSALNYTGLVSDVDQTSRNRIDDLHPEMRNDALVFLFRAQHELDLNVRITDGFRSIGEQNALYAQGRTTPGSIVSNARGGRSYHNYGLGIDVAFMQDNGGVNWSTANYNRLAPLGRRLGFEWGGDWTSIIDRPHFQMTYGFSTRQLLQRVNSGQTVLDNENTYPTLNDN